MKRFRLIRSGPSDAMSNMELDENIFRTFMEDGIPTFRIYGWASPSFTYGVSQKPEDEIDIKRCASDGIGIAKRMTGGGVLFHNNEITYSLVCAKEDIGEPDSVFVSYRKICSFLISFYRSLGLDASFALESEDFKTKCAPHELCSASREKYDIVINGKKIGGNAQKRKRRAVFQHGSIPISIDWALMRRYVRHLPEDIHSGVTTLTEELKLIPDKRVLEDMLIAAAAKEFDAQFIKEECPHEAIMAQ
ncbi:MAG: lipoate--protein ligase family protein [Candidatus Omnitrophica bacterium]|nr:lipoate--protein ligase family protein [Candidatus Omnitrophota bacterium]